ncbi:MAG TPA: FtsQ-type POTRA domain-containing protein [Acidobacteriota bacterium]|nr:FtsQ-type POTRA domain-containing protein [Acidobacteriota bacterium]
MAKSKTKPTFAGRLNAWRDKAGTWLATGTKTVISALAVAVVGLFLYQAWASPTGRPYFAVEEVVFEGLERVKRPHLQELVRDAARGNILHVDLQQVRRRVESVLWVESAVVRRRLPDALVIGVTERKPVAVAQVGRELLLVDRHGVLLGHYDPQFDLSLPIVIGLQGSTGEPLSEGDALRMQRFWDVVEDLRSGGVDYNGHISDIDVSDRRRVVVTPIDEPVPVILGGEDFNKRFRIFLSQLDRLREASREHGAIQEVDVSFPNRLIIRTARKEQPEVALSR